MAIQITACHLCAPDVVNFFVRKGIPYETRKIANGKTRVDVNISSPSKWQEGSLAKACWSRINFTYHAAVRNGNKISCSNC